MLTIDQFSKKVNLKPRTIRKAIRENRIRHQSNGDEALIPSDEIAPLSKAQIQGLIWVILRYKNDKDARPDISKIEKLEQDQLFSAFKQLNYRKFIDNFGKCDSLQSCFDLCRVTQLGIDLVQSKRLPGSFISKRLVEESLTVVITVFVQALSKYPPIA